MFLFRIWHRVTGHGIGHMTRARTHGKAASASSSEVHSGYWQRQQREADVVFDCFEVSGGK